MQIAIFNFDLLQQNQLTCFFTLLPREGPKTKLGEFTFSQKFFAK